jgi:ElaB/YqjD/DUF883 family membrane-anchored ribosome-binding protein
MATLATKDKSTEDFETEMAALRKDLAALRTDVAALASAATRVASDRKDRAAEAVREKAAELTAKGEDLAAAVEREVRARPIAAVAIAFGIGYVFAKSRRR